MTEKQKPARERLMLRSGGMVIFAPIVAGFAALLVVLAVIVGVVVFAGSPETGVPADVVPFLLATWGAIMLTLLGISYATLRYLRGIWRLTRQRRFVRHEEKRIEHLQISGTGISDGMTMEDLAAYAEIDAAQQAQSQRYS